MKKSYVPCYGAYACIEPRCLRRRIEQHKHTEFYPCV